MKTLHEMRSAMSQDGILMCFNGPFSHSIIEELGNAVKKYLESEDIQKTAMMDVFSVYIEATQNVRNYALRENLDEETRSMASNGILVIGKEGDRYTVSSGNVLLRKDGEALVQRLDRLCSLDKAGLKALYKEQMRREIPDGALGAGLGLIDMARKASAPLVYDLTPEGKDHVFFSLRVTI